MFEKSNGNASDSNRDSSSAQEVKRSTVGHSAAPEATSSISSGLSIVGKIIGQGRLAIFGQVEGEVHASTVQIGDGAHVEGDIVAEELTIGGRVKGTIHANRVKLNSTAVVEGDIYHRTLAIEENARFEGLSRREEKVIDLSPSIQANPNGVSIEDNRKQDVMLDNNGKTLPSLPERDMEQLLAVVEGRDAVKTQISTSAQVETPMVFDLDKLPAGSRIERRFKRPVAFLPDGSVIGDTDSGPRQFKSFEEWRHSIGK
jgi:cytoskeletal protein CcmA (bactofilin family)